MAVLADNSTAGNALTLMGSAETRKETPSWTYAHKIVPTGFNARVAGDAFGTILDQDGTTMVVGTPNHPYDDQGLNPLANAGSIWVYHRALAPASRPALTATPSKQTFLYTGADQLFTVPAGVTRIRTKLWGAGGGGSLGGGRGGCGGYTEAEIAVEPGETLSIMVGQAGQTLVGNTYAYGYGGGGAKNGNSNQGGSGGGRSAIRRTWGADNEIVTAGGGGGGNSSQQGGHGGGVVGGIGGGYYSGAGTQISSPVPGGNGNQGQKFYGGVANINGAAGGGGYFGGNGNNDSYNGTGGSGFIGGAISGFMSQPHSADTPYNSGDVDYGSGAAVGGGTSGVNGGTVGGSGRVVLSWISDAVSLVDSQAWSQVARVVPTGMNARNANDTFGKSVAVSGEWMAVAAPTHDWDVDGTNQTFSAGAVFMYQRVNDVWVQQQKVLATGNNARASADQFGYSVDLSGTTLVVGSPFHEFNAVGGGSLADAGAVFVYTLIEGVWVLQQKLVASGISGRNSLDNFGAAVKISGTRIAVHAPGHAYDITGQNGLDQAGAVFVFDYTTTWTLSAKLVSNLRTELAHFGATLDLNGATLVAGSTVMGTSEIFRNTTGTTWVNQDTRRDTTSVNASTAVLLRFDNGALLDSAVAANAQPTTSGNPLTYNSTRARFGTTSLSMNGTTNIVLTGSRGNLNIPGDWTVEFWINHQEAPYSTTGPIASVPFTYPSIVSGSGWSFNLTRPAAEYGAGDLVCNVSGVNGNGTVDMGVVNIDTWEHIAMVRKGARINLFRNGTCVGGFSFSGNRVNAADGNLVFGTANYKGFINDFRISTEAKYNADFTPPQHAFRANDVPGLARGTTFALMDDSTVLVGLPLASGVDAIGKHVVNETFPNRHVDVAHRVANGGLVQTLTRNGATWDSVINVAAAGSASMRNAGDNFGSAVVVRDGAIAVSATSHSRNFLNQEHTANAGAVFTYRIDGDSVRPLRKMLSGDRTVDARYGRALDIMGGQLLITSPTFFKYRTCYNDGTGADYSNSYSGYSYYSGNLYDTYTYAYVLKYTDYTWRSSKLHQYALGDMGLWQNGRQAINNTTSARATNQAPSNTTRYNSTSYGNYPPANFVYNTGTFAYSNGDTSGYPLVGEAMAWQTPTLAVFSNPSATFSDGTYDSTTSGMVQTRNFTTGAVTANLGVPGSANNRLANDLFGWSVATDGTRIAIGAINHSYDTFGKNPVSLAGALYTYVQSPDVVWTLEQKILSPGRTTSAYYGRELAMNATGFIATGVGRSDLYTRSGTGTTPWLSVDNITSYQSFETNDLSVAAVNSTTFVNGVPRRNLPIANFAGTGDAMLLRQDNKPLTVSGSVTTTSAIRKFGTSSATFQDGTGVITLPKTTDWRFASLDWTVEFWVNTAAVSGDIFTNIAGASFLRSVITATGKLQTVSNNANSISTLSINDSVWHHVAIAKSGTTVNTFIDGALQSTHTQAVGTDTFVQPTIGTGFVGYLDDFRISMGVARYTTAFALPTAQPFGTQDPQWATVALAMNFETGIRDLSQRWWINETANDPANLVPPGLYNGRLANDQFGKSVALGNNMLAVGVPGYTFAPNGVYNGVGAQGGIHMFSYVDQQGEWYAQTQLPAGGTLSGSMRMGEYVSFTGNYVAGGGIATWNSTQGVAKVWYQVRPGTWNYQYQATGIANANQTNATLMDDATLIVGGQGYTTSNATYAGGFLTHTRLGATWSLPSTNPQYVPLSTNGRIEYNALVYSGDMYVSRGRNAQDAFGTAVSISNQGDLLVVGSPNHSYQANSAGSASYAGAAFVYYWDVPTLSWRFQQKLQSGNPTYVLNSNNNQFARRLDMRDGYLMAAGPATGQNSTRGFANFFLRQGSGVTGSFVYQNEILGTANSEHAGYDITLLTNSFAAMGSPFLNSVNVPSLGSFRSINRSSALWSVGPYNSITGLAYGRLTNDQFGRSVALYQGTLLVGAPYSTRTSDGTSQAGGSVFAYNFDSARNVFTYGQRLVSENVGNALFGWQLDFHGNLAVSTGGSTNNRTTILSRTTTGAPFTVQPTIVGSEGQGQSATVVNDTQVVVGMPQRTLPDPSVPGMVGIANIGAWRTITNVSGTWTLGAINVAASFNSQGYEGIGYAQSRGTNFNFGRSVSIGTGGTLIAVGAPNQSVNEYGSSVGVDGTGAVFMYSYDVTLGRYVFNTLIQNPSNQPQPADSQFGTSVDLKGDRLLVGAPGSNGRGSIYTYQLREPTVWSLEKRLSQGGVFGMGSAVAFIQDNTILSAGMPLHNGYPGLTSAGRVYTQRLVGQDWVSLDQREGAWGLNAQAFNTNNTSNNPGGGGGGGSGAIGGAGGQVGYFLNGGGYGGLGGTNLVPAGATAYVGNLTNAPLDSDPDRANAGQGGAKNTNIANGTSGTPGSHARIVLSWSDGKQAFDYTGDDQLFRVPSGVTSLDFKMWGAGGGSAARSYGTGGAGAALVGSLPVTPGETLTLMVGMGGLGGANSNVNAFRADLSPRYGGGGLGGIVDGTPAITSNGANGGGRAEIARGTVSLAIAGGGGGGGSGSSAGAPNTPFQNGQPAGAPTSGASRNRTAANASSEMSLTGFIRGRNSNDQFGTAVAQDSVGNILVGVPYHGYDELGELFTGNRGAVFTYNRNSTRRVTTYSGRFVGTNVTNSYFGNNINTLGDRVLITSGNFSIVSAPAANGGGNGNGALDFYQYQPLTKTWSLETHLDGTSAGANVYLRAALASDKLSVVGLPVYTGALTPNTGIVTGAGGFDTLTRNGTVWSTVTRNVVQGLSFGRFSGDYFGSSVKLGGDWLAIGAYQHSYNESGLGIVSNMGAVFVYKLDRNTGNWIYDTKLTAIPLGGTTTNVRSLGFRLSLLDGTLIAPYYTSAAQQGFVSWSRDQNTGVWSYNPTALVNSAVAPNGNNFPYVVVNPSLYWLGSYAQSAGIGAQPSVTGAGTGSTLTNVGGTWTLTPNTFNVPGASNGRQSGDQFGFSVYSGGNYVAVGNYNHPYNEIGVANPGTGTINIYSQPGGAFGTEWRLERIISSGLNTSVFSSRLSGSGAYLLASDNVTNSQLWQRVTPGNWKLVNSFNVLDSGGGSPSTTLANPDMVVIGQPTASGVNAGKTAVSNSGTVATFTRNSGTWTARTQISEQGTSFARNSSDQFGFSLALSRNFLIVGAPYHAYDVDGANSLANAGAMFVYSRVGNTYAYLNKFTAPAADRASNARYAHTLSIDELNTHVAVGHGALNLTYAYGFDGLRMTVMSRIVGPVSAGFGTAVSINNGRLAVGAPQFNGTSSGLPTVTNAGAVFTYRLNNAQTSWDLVSTNVPTTRTPQALYGTSVSVSRSATQFVGAPGDLTSGSVWFKYVP